MKLTKTPNSFDSIDPKPVVTPARLVSLSLLQPVLKIHTTAATTALRSARLLHTPRRFAVRRPSTSRTLLCAAGVLSSMATSASPVLSVAPLSFPFATTDPFLFCVYHKDAYPTGSTEHMYAPRRGNGADFDWSAPYRMYHGDRVPGFPQHPHRGFETLTVVVEGTCDHTDSLGGGGRYGGDGRRADLQWMTAGSGCVHGENFPLRHSDKPNTLRLFQLWLNLPACSKMAAPGYQMLWAEQMQFIAGSGGAECQVVAGQLGGVVAGAPPPESWAADPAHDVGVFLVTLPPGGRFELPAVVHGARVNRSAHIVEGPTDAVRAPRVRIAGAAVPRGRATITLRADMPALLENDNSDGETAQVLILQGVPIGEPVAQRGPFVMNNAAEIEQAYADYRRTQFGGWPWADDAVVFAREQGRFADIVVEGKKVRTLPPVLKSELR